MSADTTVPKPQILCIVTGGAGDGRRARRLLSAVPSVVTYYDVDKSRSRRDSSREIWSLISSRRWDLVFQEGTGIAGGANLIRAARRNGQPYIISSGDPIGGFFRVTRGPAFGFAFEQYEKLLYRNSTAFVGWTPYLTGMALRMGAPRGATIEGGVDLDTFQSFDSDRRLRIRTELGIPDDHIVCGVVGSLQWNPRHNYCYGLELAESIKYVNRNDASFVVVGDGSGLQELQRRVPQHLSDRVVFTGRVEPKRVVELLNAMDVGLITQTLDGLGSYRLTTKLPEYLATGLPIAMSPIPGYYDYVAEAGWSLPPVHPANAAFHEAFARWLDALDRDDIALRSAKARQIAIERFDYNSLCPRFSLFVEDILKLYS